MRICVLLLASLSTASPLPGLAGPPVEAAPNAAPTTPTAPQAAKPEAATPTAKPPPDADTRHFLALGYRPEKRGAEEVYCRRELALGSRLSPVKNCGTILQLKIAEQKTKAGLYDAQRQETRGPISK